MKDEFVIIANRKRFSVVTHYNLLTEFDEEPFEVVDMDIAIIDPNTNDINKYYPTELEESTIYDRICDAIKDNHDLG